MFRHFSVYFVFALLALLLTACYFWSSPTDRAAILNTILLGVGASVIAIPLALAIAGICLRRGWIPRLLWASCLCLIFVPLFLHVSAWDSAFGKLGWWLNVSRFRESLFSSWAPAVWIHAVAAAPQVALIIWFGLWKSGRSYEDQAMLETDASTVFWRITLPRILPLLGAGAVWIIVSCAREIAVTDIYQIGTLAEQIYLGYSLGEFNNPNRQIEILPVAGILPAISLSGVIAALVLAAVCFYSGGILQSDQITERSMPSSTIRLNLTGLLLLAILVVVPAISLVVRASKSVEMMEGEPAVQFSFLSLVQVINSVPFRFASEIQWSTLISLVSSACIMLLAILVSWKAHESKTWLVLLLISIALAASIPGPLIGSTLLDARGVIDSQMTNWLFDRTIFAPVLANLIFCWSVSCLLVWIVLRSTAVDALEHARLEGSSSFSRFVRIAVAGNFFALLGCLVLVFGICFGELSASQLAIPPGIDTVPRRMLGLLHSGVNNETAGLTIVSVAFIVLVCAVGWWLVRWKRHDNRQ